MKDIKVAMFIPFNFPAYGGTELATYNLSRELRAQGLCKVRIWAFGKGGQFSAKRNADLSVDRLKILNEVPVLSYTPIQVLKLKDLSIKLAIDLNNSEENILHFQGTHRIVSRMLLAKTVKKKITVLTTHALQESIQIINGKGGVRFLMNPVFFGSLNSVDHIIALSSKDVNVLCSFGINREKITCIPNGIDDKKFKSREQFVNKNDKFKLLSVGRFQENKNYEALIEITARLIKEYPIETYIVGSLANQSYFNKIVHLIKQKGLEETVKIGLSLDDAELTDCYKSCNLFVFLSTMETSPIAVMEAMYAGLPIVATNVGGIPELVVNGINGFLSPPDANREIYDHIVELLGNFTLRQRISDENKRKAKDYTWARTAIKTHELYQKLVG